MRQKNTKIYSQKQTILFSLGLFLTLISTLILLKTLLKMFKTLIFQGFYLQNIGIFVKTFTLQNKWTIKKQCIYKCIYTVIFERKNSFSINRDEVPRLVAFLQLFLRDKRQRLYRLQTRNQLQVLLLMAQPSMAPP